MAFGYYTPIPINYSTDGAQTDYQMKLTIYSGSGTNVAGSVYLNSHAGNWPYDIQFKNSSGTTLNFWRESYDSTSQVVWVKIDSIKASNTTHTWLYYGDSGASDTSSGDNTFGFFDDFNGTAYDSSKWVLSTSSTPTITVANGRMTVAGVNTSWAAIGSISKFGLNRAVDYSVYSFTNASTTYGLDGGFSNAYYSDSTSYNSTIRHKHQVIQNNNNGTISTVDFTGVRVAGIYTVKRFSGSTKASLNYGTETALTTNVQTVDERISFNVTNDTAAGTITLNWARVRNTTLNEPTWATPGNESQVSTFNYKVSIPIIHSTDGAQTNYQVKLTINSGSGTNSAGVIYLNNHSLNWPYDIRFENSSGAILDYWRESYDSSSQVVWAEVDNIPISGTATITMYYGNSAVTDASDGTSTFEVYTHFDDANVPIGWTKGANIVLTYNGDSTVTISNDVFESVPFYSNKFTFPNKAFRWRGKFHGTTGSNGCNAGFGSDFSGHLMEIYCSYNQKSLRSRNGGSYTLVTTNLDTSIHVYDEKAIPGSVIFTKDGVAMTGSPLTTNLMSDTTGVYVYFTPLATSGSTHAVTVDWAVVRNCTTNEPMWATPGNENRNFDYKVSIPVWRTTDGAQTNYQMKLIIYSGVGTNSAGNIYLNNHAGNWPYDILFTSATGLTLDYWRESYDSTSQVVWLECDSISTDRNTIFTLYYGNADANDASNGDNTFQFFDDFAGSSLDSTKWDTNNQTNSSVSVSSGKLQLTTADNLSGAGGAGIVSKNTMTIANATLEAVVKRVVANKTGELGLLVGVTDKTGRESTYYGAYGRRIGGYLYEYTGSSRRYEVSSEGGTTAYGSTSSGAFLNVDTRIVLKMTPSTKVAVGTFSNTNLAAPLTLSCTGTTDLTAWYVAIQYGEYGNFGTNGFCNFIFLRKSTTNEPTWGTPSVEIYQFSYKVNIPISATADGAQTNYQVKLTVYSGAGTNSAGVIYLNNHSSNWPYDLIFQNSSGAILDYWRESYDSLSQVIWVEVDSIAASGTTSIDLYYGKSSFADISNGNYTFIFYDDCSSLSNWTSTSAGSTSTTVSSGKILMTGAAGTANKSNLRSNSTVCGATGGVVLSTKVSLNQTTDYNLIMCLTPETPTEGASPTSNLVGISGISSRSPYYPGHFLTINGTNAFVWSEAAVLTGNTTYKMELYSKSGSEKYVRDGTTKNSQTSTYDLGGNLYIFYKLSCAWDQACSYSIDDVNVRKYTANEPAWSTPGSEQQLISLIGFSYGFIFG